jgi:4-phospho-D-threonate 3-dehydrogenase / 4-phospho-D-erythronate 3-dehydrogenase
MRIGITLGDPAGIGPEIVAKSVGEFPDDDIYLIGNEENYRSTLKQLKIPYHTLEKNHITFIDIPHSNSIRLGQVQKSAGEVALQSIEKAVRLAQENELDDIVTAPINKESIILAGSKFVDHETMLASLTDSKRVSTVFEVESLRIVFMSPKHVSLKQAVQNVTKQNVMESILSADRCMRLLGIPNGRIAVSALNPHAGDGGLLGSEEKEEIEPALREARSKSIDVNGPYPADSIFQRASRGEFDIVVSLYHDQGHIAAKMKNFLKTVSLTMGLPFLRTSVDHGTAFDIAGKGTADPESMIEAMRSAKKYGLKYRERYSEIY